MQLSFHLPQIQSSLDSWILTKQTRCYVLFKLRLSQTFGPELIHFETCLLFLFGFIINIKNENSERLKSAFLWE